MMIFEIGYYLFGYLFGENFFEKKFSPNPFQKTLNYSNLPKGLLGKPLTKNSPIVKKSNYPIIIVFFLFFLLLNSSPCLSSNQTLIKDMAGREVKIPQDINRIIALGPGSLRFVTYLGAIDMVVGVENIEKTNTTASRPYNVAIYDKIKDLPVVSEGGPGKLPDIERIIAIKPDLVLIYGIEPSQVDMLQAKSNIPFIVCLSGNFGVFSEEGMKSLLLMGKILNREERAKKIIEFYDNIKNDLKNRTKDINLSPKVYVGGLGYKGAQGITSTDTNFPPFEMVNANNVALLTKKSGHVFIDKEQLLIWQPLYVFLDTNSLNIIKDDYLKNPLFYKSIKAIKENRCFSIISYNSYNTNVELLLINSYFIGKTLYPQRFKDIDMANKTDEITNFFLGIPLYERLKKEGRIFGKIIFEEKDVVIRQE